MYYVCRYVDRHLPALDKVDSKRRCLSACQVPLHLQNDVNVTTYSFCHPILRLMSVSWVGSQGEVNYIFALTTHPIPTYVTVLALPYVGSYLTIGSHGRTDGQDRTGLTRPNHSCRKVGQFRYLIICLLTSVCHHGVSCTTHTHIHQAQPSPSNMTWHDMVISALNKKGKKQKKKRIISPTSLRYTHSKQLAR